MVELTLGTVFLIVFAWEFCVPQALHTLMEKGGALALSQATRVSVQLNALTGPVVRPVLMRLPFPSENSTALQTTMPDIEVVHTVVSLSILWLVAHSITSLKPTALAVFVLLGMLVVASSSALHLLFKFATIVLFNKSKKKQAIERYLLYNPMR